MVYIHVPPVQQQIGIMDCGVFAIAFAVHCTIIEYGAAMEGESFHPRHQ